MTFEDSKWEKTRDTYGHGGTGKHWGPGMACIRPLPVFVSTLALALLYFSLALSGLNGVVRIPIPTADRSKVQEIGLSNSSVKVLLIAYGRSGSSLAGEFLSLAPGARYYFEPLFFAKDAMKLDLRQEFSLMSIYLLDSLFNCSMHAVNILLPESSRNSFWKNKYYKHPPCDGSDRPQVAKVIRFLLDHDALAWLRSRDDIKLDVFVQVWNSPKLGRSGNQRDIDDYSNRHDRDCICETALLQRMSSENPKVTRIRKSRSIPDLLFQVVHWVRDPRGMLNSMRSAPLIDDFQRDPWQLCDQIGHDILAIDSLPPNRWRRVSYEDLMSNPTEVTRDLYRFLGIPWPSDGDRRISVHFAAEPKMKPLYKYYSTYRNASGFDPYHWKREMGSKEKTIIERACGDVMDALGYQREVVTGPLRVEEIEKEFMLVAKKLHAKLSHFGPLSAGAVRRWRGLKEKRGRKIRMRKMKRYRSDLVKRNIIHGVDLGKIK
ncbi:unnamed protein product [Darwinula stevensoni]|uniref:Sulfotransferase n=1 Tax=Darwinula stevensoni TaxID=69355 RepID=A0A7R9ACM1_9CRUS|nr:unnamed protein product [Darwinula stevensoni]CAG0900500.1 unnamed protein product [Darwinula stevensoni]